MTLKQAKTIQELCSDVGIDCEVVSQDDEFGSLVWGCSLQGVSFDLDYDIARRQLLRLKHGSLRDFAG